MAARLGLRERSAPSGRPLPAIYRLEDAAGAAPAPGTLRYVEVPGATPLSTLRELREAGHALVLGLGEPEAEGFGAGIPEIPAKAWELFAAAGWAFTAGGDDPMALNAAIPAVVAALERAPRRVEHPPRRKNGACGGTLSHLLRGWLTALGVGGDAEAPARAVQFAAHALALGVERVFLAPPWEAPVLEATLQAYEVLRAQLAPAEHIGQTARGQYRIEIPGRHNRYLLWAGAGIRRLPSSLQGPLLVTDLSGQSQRVETSRLKLTPRPVFVDRL